METGDLVKSLRENAGLSQAALARKASISNDYMHKIETGKVKNIGTEVISSIAEALGVHPSLLLYGEIMTPKITLQEKDSIGPLNEKEKALVLNYRHTSSDTERKVIEDVAKQFAKR